MIRHYSVCLRFRRRFSLCVLIAGLAPVLAIWHCVRAADNSVEKPAPAHSEAPKIPAPTPAEAAENAAAEKRLADATRYLASDQLDGRGLGSHGNDLAGEYIADEFRKIGLKTDLYAGQPFQDFKLPVGTKLGSPEHNRLEILGPQGTAGGIPPVRMEFKVGVDFNPLALGGSGKFDLPLVFVGYGISAKAEKYDDYAGIDVKDKAVIILRHQPQRSNPHGLFGNQDATYAAFSRKVANAYEHGAGAVIFTTDGDEIRRNTEARERTVRAAKDALRDAEGAFQKIEHPSADQTAEQKRKIERLTERLISVAEQAVERGERLPVFAIPPREARASTGRSNSRDLCPPGCRRSDYQGRARHRSGDDRAANRQAGASRPRARIDRLARCRRDRFDPDARGIAQCAGGTGRSRPSCRRDDRHRRAHYDHLGHGEFGSLASGSATHDIHHGADDNGSGTAALLEVARRLAGRKEKLPRRILFIAFTGEEEGLLGSARYVRDPLIPLDKTIAMLNLDMVGRMKDDKLTMGAMDTATEFEPLLKRLNENYGFKIIPEPGGFGPSDHATFYGKKIPVLFFFTGLHEDYHKPSDTADKLDVPDMRRVADFASDAAVALAEAKERPHFTESTAHGSHPGMRGGDRPFFGSIPDFGREDPGGYAISGVTKASPAEVGGLKAGDVIIHFGESKIGGLDDFDSALRKHRAGDKVPLTVRRDGKEVKLEVTLDPPQ